MKKILTVGYYADFSRFFNQIKLETSKISSDYTFYHINLHLSGYIYSLMHRQKSVYLPWASNRHRSKGEGSIQEDYERFIKYHVTLNPGIDKIKLQQQTAKYYDYFEVFLNDYRPDLIIVSGDSRMPIEVLQFIASQRSIEVLHFEQAPLGRTILDSRGVNANCSCRDVGALDLNKVNETDEIKPYKETKWDGYKKYRFIDIFIEKFLPFMQPIEHIRPKRNIVDKKLYHSLQLSRFSQNDALNKDVYLLVLQVPDDVNMIYHSPYFSNHYEIVKAVHRALPEGSVLVVREHPLFKQLYEPELYTYINEHIDVFFDCSARLFDAMNTANVVVVNNSTVGLESIEIGKPVVILGNAYYDQFPLCFKYKGENLEQLLVDASCESTQEDLMLRKKYLVYLFNHYFTPGHFRDLNGPAPANIAKWISENVH
ncbi:hypothetical protein [Enterobacter sp. ENT02]|jgi:capsular polysaccharide export protein|uniref:capsular polysaccharide export protein, LipB/KpsS family n=1 Tax=Enterobacter TaxID=547 RepID=UPI001C46B2E4|nr:hypothetical protein [Enterobacter sp. ENT02]MBV7557225.1 hypothetical protein [Enterobacter sp. ENT02]